MVPLSAGASTDEGENGAGSGAGSGSAGRIPLSGRALLDALERQAPAEVPDRGAFICGFRSECGRTLWEPLVLTCGHAVCRGCERRQLRIGSAVSAGSGVGSLGDAGGTARAAAAAASAARLKCPVCRRRVIGDAPPKVCLQLHELVRRAFPECAAEREQEADAEAAAAGLKWHMLEESEEEKAAEEDEEAAEVEGAEEEDEEAAEVRGMEEAAAAEDGTEEEEGFIAAAEEVATLMAGGMPGALAAQRGGGGEGDGVPGASEGAAARAPGGDGGRGGGGRGGGGALAHAHGQGQSAASRGGPSGVTDSDTQAAIGGANMAGSPPTVAAGTPRRTGGPPARPQRTAPTPAPAPPPPPDPTDFTHFGVGCDVCGVYPIRGRRFKCLDCPEAIGFDLCDACHLNAIADADAADASVGDIIRGRFNQTHRPGHQMAAGSHLQRSPVATPSTTQ